MALVPISDWQRLPFFNLPVKDKIMQKKCASFFLSMLAVLFSATACLADMPENEFEPISLGNIKVYPIVDATTNAESSLLPELDNFPQFAQIFTHGPVTAVSRSFYITDGDRKILMDTGWGNELAVRGHTREVLEAHGISPASITDIVLTHLDADHIGGLVENGKPVYPDAVIWVAEPEARAWRDGRIQKRPQSFMDRVNGLWQAYPDKIKMFHFGDEILPGIFALDASGHTPGHTAYEIVDGRNKMLIAGDVMHLYQVQLQKPELSSKYDMDMAKAAQTRAKLLNRASEEKSIFAAMHVAPVSQVLKRQDGGFMMREPR